MSSVWGEVGSILYYIPVGVLRFGFTKSGNNGISINFWTFTIVLVSGKKSLIWGIIILQEVGPFWSMVFFVLVCLQSTLLLKSWKLFDWH